MDQITHTPLKALPPPDRRRSLWQRVRRPSRGMLILLISLIALAALIYYLVNRGGGDARGRRPSATVGVVAATKADIPITLTALGAATPRAMVTVIPQVSGVLTSVNFTEGQMVTAGQVLAVVDQRPFNLALEQAQGTLARDTAQLTNAQLQLSRYQTLLKQDSIAQQDVDTQAATVRQLQGTVEADKASVDTAKLNLAYSTITAPVSGRIGLRVVDAGNYISAGSSSGVAVITQVQPMDVSFAVPEDDLSAIRTAMQKGQPVPVTVYDRTKTTALAKGSLLTLDNQVDATTGTIKSKATFDNADNALFPSQFVNVEILVDTVKDAVVVPAAAVRHGPNGDFVYTVGDDHAAHMKQVKAGPTNGDSVSITSGLDVGEKVVTEGGDRLEDGAQVQLPGDAPPADNPDAQKKGKHGHRRQSSGDGGGG